MAISRRAFETSGLGFSPIDGQARSVPWSDRGVQMTNRWEGSVLVAAAVISVACARSAETPAVQQQNVNATPTNVLVQNGTSQPIPTAATGVTAVSGTVDIAGIPSVTVTNPVTTVAATQGGAWTVTVVNPAGAPVGV